MAIQSEPTANRLTAIAGILGAIAASSCCVLPLLFASLGISGAWIGNLTALAPYQPLALTVAVLGYGFYSVYWRPRQACSDGTCERPLPSRNVKLGLWLGTILVAVALIFPRIALVLAGY
ncbi:MAG TPA: mercuric transporter MerT family protein [Bradyrhizobium sp.]|jgi:mercuric ion transport protein|nr:mercuric transporter MerT family protein [Bradyrhizobium sp.]